MSQKSIPRSIHAVQRDSTFALPFPIIECGNLAVFLDLLPPSSTVLLMPLRRREELGAIEVTLAVQMTAHIAEMGGSAILTATFMASACTLLGGVGSLLVPGEEREKPAEYVQRRAHDLQGELLACLEARLCAHPSVACVYHPARYRVPGESVWRLASLAGSGISFTMGHWTYPQARPDDHLPSDQSPA